MDEREAAAASERSHRDTQAGVPVVGMASEQGMEQGVEPIAAAMLQSAEERRQTIDQMMWQVPALSLTAQSFLLTIALGNASATARLVAGLLALIASLATVQLLLRHRFHELEWSLWLQNRSLDSDWSDMHDPQRRRELAWSGEHPWLDPGTRPHSALSGIAWSARRSIVRASSVLVWVAALVLFAIADLGAAVYGALVATGLA